MGYELHITRREDWADEDDPSIALEEWVAYVASDPEMKPDAENPTPDNAIYVGPAEEWPFWWVRRGEIQTKNPTREAIVKMVAIAGALGARVQGDDSEVYGLDPSDPTRSRNVQHARQHGRPRASAPCGRTFPRSPVTSTLSVERCGRGASAILPVSWAPTLMRNRKDSHLLAEHFIHHCVWEMPEVVTPGAILVFGPVFCRGGQTVDGVKQVDPERVRSYRASVEIPEECLARLCLRFGQYLNIEGTHRELRRCRTSVQGAACTRPARNSARRRFTSARHSSETVASSAVSKLSRSATAKAERSSTGRPRTSSRRWSTRAFMRVSLAPRTPCATGVDG
jgi:hypothetical protein